MANANGREVKVTQKLLQGLAYSSVEIYLWLCHAHLKYMPISSRFWVFSVHSVDQILRNSPGNGMFQIKLSPLVVDICCLGVEGDWVHF